MNLSPLPQIMLEPLVRAALLEDLGRAGDITTDAIVPADTRATVVLAARQPGVVAGLDLATLAFRLIDPSIEMKVAMPDGSRLVAGDVIATLSGPARGLLSAERVALNFLCHLSGIATATSGIVEAVRGHKAKFVTFRTPNSRIGCVTQSRRILGNDVEHRLNIRR